MADIDLIPTAYRKQLDQRCLLRRYAIAFVALNCCIVAVAIALAHIAGRNQARAVELQTLNAITQQQQIQLQQLKEQQAEYERQWSLLRGLRAGAAVDEIFTLIDQSIVSGDLWFLEWNFRRAGVIVDGEQRGVETGYFIIVPEDGSALVESDLEVETQMSIHGQAIDHQALSKFVRALFEQPDIKDVSVQKTSQTDYANGRAVDFELTVVLNSSYRDT